MAKPVRQEDMDAVYALTDALGIHREAVTVPLRRQDPGGVRSLPGGSVEISLPEIDPVDAWIDGELRRQLGELGYTELP